MALVFLFLFFVCFLTLIALTELALIALRSHLLSCGGTGSCEELLTRDQTHFFITWQVFSAVFHFQSCSGLQDSVASTSVLDVPLRKSLEQSQICWSDVSPSSHAPVSQRAGWCLSNRLIAPRPHLYTSNVNFPRKALQTFFFLLLESRNSGRDCALMNMPGSLYRLFTQRRILSAWRDGLTCLITCLT